MKGTTNAQRGATDVVQTDSKVTVLNADIQTATDTKTGLMSSADHKKILASGEFVEDDSKIVFKNSSGGTVFEVTGISGGSGVQFTLKVSYTGASNLSGISVTATPVSGATATVQGTTNSSGIAYLSVKQNATYKITSSKTGYAFTSIPEVTCADLTTEATISCYVPGQVTVTVTDEKASVVGRKVTATASGQITQTQTVASGSTSVVFSLPAGTWTFSVDYPSGATGGGSATMSIANDRKYDLTLKVIYNMVFGFRIAVGTSDPSARVTYPQTIFGQTNNAYGKTPAIGTGVNCMNGWARCELITGIKRQTCVDGVWADVESRTDAVVGTSTKQVMTYVPTWYMKMTNDGTNIDCAFSMEQIDSTWKDYAGSVGSIRKGHFRVGCYVCKSDYKSYIGRPLTGKSITDFIAGSEALGTGYDIMTWYQWTYLAALAVLLYKSTNLQMAMAQGYVGGSSVQTEAALTFTNDYGMYGTSGNKTTQMAFFWIQNLWGNMHQFVGGAKTDSSSKLMTQMGYSSIAESTFTKVTPEVGVSLSGYISKVAGTTDAGFFPTEISGSETTYFADYGYVRASDFPCVGSDCGSGDLAGPFYAYFYYGAGSANSGIGSRLSYRL